MNKKQWLHMFNKEKLTVKNKEKMIEHSRYWSSCAYGSLILKDNDGSVDHHMNYDVMNKLTPSQAIEGFDFTRLLLNGKFKLAKKLFYKIHGIEEKKKK